MLLTSLDIKEAAVGFSGGADSTALLHLLKHNTNIALTAVHINHNINSKSNDWAAFCRAFCEAHSIRYVQADVTVDISSNVEENARKARYDVFKNFGNIILGHHVGDQEENFFLKVLRGSGVFGLSGMRTHSVTQIGGKVLNIYRPLLNYTKQDLIEYCIAKDLMWIEDPSNQTDDYDRNKIRLNVLPQIKEALSNRFSAGLSKSMKALQVTEDCLVDLAELDLSKCYDENKFSLDRLKELSEHRLLNMFHYWIYKNHSTVRSTGLVEFTKQIYNADYNSRVKLECNGNTKILIQQKGKWLYVVYG